MFNIVIFGPPGSGKGTQSELLIKDFGLMHFATGDIFRQEIKKRSTIGQKIDSIISQGNLVPEEIVREVVEKNILENMHTIKGFLFDGFPRTTLQAEFLDNLLEKNNMKLHKGIYLDVPEDALFDRIRYRAKIQGRPDDTDETLKNRLIIYEKETAPLTEYYNKKGIVLTIKGAKKIEETGDIIRGEILQDMKTIGCSL